jgi:hypothetical protein
MNFIITYHNCNYQRGGSMQNHVLLESISLTRRNEPHERELWQLTERESMKPLAIANDIVKQLPGGTLIIMLIANIHYICLCSSSAHRVH